MRSIFAEPLDAPAPGEPAFFGYAFDIVDTREVGEPARLRIEAHAQAPEGIAGFGLEYDRGGWCRDQVYADIWFDFGWGSIFSLGAPSDAFARFLSREIGDGTASRFVDRIETDVAMLNSEPDAMLTRTCRSKFFFGDDDESEAQVFINFDVSNGIVEFREKDLDYRRNLLRNLVAH